MVLQLTRSPEPLDPERILAQSLTEHVADWDALQADQDGELSTAQKRWKEHELEWRMNLAKQGQMPAVWLIADIRSGKKEQRDRANMENFLRNQAKLAKWRREGYSFDAEHRLVAPQAPRIHIPRRLEDRVPRGRRGHGPRRTPARPSDDPDEPEVEPALRVISPEAFASLLDEAGL
jgi:hypothetical protein